MTKSPNNNDIPRVSGPDYPHGGEPEPLPQVKGYKIIKCFSSGEMARVEGFG